ncbi:MAG: hypothetical protein U5K79_03260 [Cyclobacteriaceae bacterium]|nr:hypothetical protein [Cyclobacteriaceae bacterium]
MKAQAPKRIAAIDIFRAGTMFLMIFVNDLWTLEGVPQWMEHAKATEDRMGLSDWAFSRLFIHRWTINPLCPAKPEV